MTTVDSSSACPAPDKVRTKNAQYPPWTTLLSALIPKYPFSLTALMSVITALSGKSTLEFTPQWTSRVSITLPLFAISALAPNNEGRNCNTVCTYLAFADLRLDQRELLLFPPDSLKRNCHLGCS